MKAFVILLASFAFLAKAQAQDQRFSIQFEDEELPSILELVTQNTGYLFSYNSNLIDPSFRFTMTAEDVSLDDFLNRLLKGTGLVHQVFDNQVVIKAESLRVIAEQSEVFSLSGRVVDSVTTEPIPGVNIFFSETNIGGVSDLDGYYIIDRVPAGSYEVIFSHLAYEMQTFRVSHESNGMFTLNTSMALEPTILDTLEVVSRRLIGPEERGKYLKIFEQEFLGRSTNAGKCEIVNPDVLDFIYDPDQDKLEAFALEPVKVVNQHLGYEILYVFDRFTKTGNLVDIYGRARFSDLEPTSKREMRAWERNRKRVYYGSFLHFRRSLVRNELRKEGFRMNLINAESLGDVSRMKPLDVEESDILELRSQGFVADFDNFLEVTYRKRPDEAYKEQFFETGNLSSQQSFLRTKGDSVVIQANGRLEYPGLETYGYWYWERLGDLLPENYNPDRNENLEIP